MFRDSGPYPRKHRILDLFTPNHTPNPNPKPYPVTRRSFYAAKLWIHPHMYTYHYSPIHPFTTASMDMSPHNDDEVGHGPWEASFPYTIRSYAHELMPFTLALMHIYTHIFMNPCHVYAHTDNIHRCIHHRQCNHP